MNLNVTALKTRRFIKLIKTETLNKHNNSYRTACFLGYLWTLFHLHRLNTVVREIILNGM